MAVEDEKAEVRHDDVPKEEVARHDVVTDQVSRDATPNDQVSQDATPNDQVSQDITPRNKADPLDEIVNEESANDQGARNEVAQDAAPHETTQHDSTHYDTTQHGINHGATAEDKTALQAIIDEKAVTIDDKAAAIDEKAESNSDPDDESQDKPQLTDAERKTLEAQLETPDIKGSFFLLYRYSSLLDRLILVVGAIMAIGSGAVIPIMTIVFGQLAGTFGSTVGGNFNKASLQHEIVHLTLLLVYLGIAEFGTALIASMAFNYTGERIVAELRMRYLSVVLRQNIGYFDKLGAGEVANTVTADMDSIQDGISLKIALMLTAISTFVTAFVVGFIKYDILALILSSTLVLVMVLGGFASKWIIKWNKQSMEDNALGASVTEEVFSSVRNVFALSAQKDLSATYDIYLERASKSGIWFKSLAGGLNAAMMGIGSLGYALGFWEGSRLLVAGHKAAQLSNILTVIFAILIGSASLASVTPNLTAFMGAIAASGRIFSTIDRVSPIDPLSEEGERPEKITGDIEFKNIKFVYPSRPDVRVLEDVSFTVPAGKKTAIVGPSGSGKTTCLELVQRFYDPLSGEVAIDGVDAKKINVAHLRRHISTVSQEPTLFNASIFENIAYGLTGTRFEDASIDEKADLIIEAAKAANIHNFIAALPEGYDTFVGNRGFLLSGGQKQRVVIARSIISDPRILILDEATSALDVKSEGAVQAALNNVASGRTTLVVAHRLSTIKDADKIVVVSGGRVVEEGDHKSLIEKKGVYHGLVEAQSLRTSTLETDTSTPESSDESTDESDSIEKMEDQELALAESHLSLEKNASRRSTASAREEGPQAQPSLWTLIKWVVNLHMENWRHLLVGLVCSSLSGGALPAQAVIYSKTIVALAQPPILYSRLRSQVDFYCWMYFMAGMLLLIFLATRGYTLAISSEGLIRRTRKTLLNSLLERDVEFFDRDENSAGQLTSFVSIQTNHLATGSGIVLGTFVEVTTTIIASYILSLAVGWKLALVCIACVPVVFTFGILQVLLTNKSESTASNAHKDSASAASEAASAIRTVASLTREQEVLDAFNEHLLDNRGKIMAGFAQSSLLYASSKALLYFVMALSFWYGGTLITNGEYDTEQFFIVLTGVIFGSYSATIAFQFAPDVGRAYNASKQIVKVVSWRDYNKETVPTQKVKGTPKTQGAVTFDKVRFQYPNRPDRPVLRDIDIAASKGQTIALVGASGCGKTTVISLLERFYIATGGTIAVDGTNIYENDLETYRKDIALVSQEPVMYQGTVSENLLMGLENKEEMDEVRLRKACAEANMTEFIESLPDGYHTALGARGVMLSGGQKQRLAIARAVLRNPRVLLLDEATSSLDTASEKIVQEALNKASEGRTTVAVAHRLSTIKQADRIFLLEEGRVIEAGTHDELVKLGRKYAEMVRLQSLDT